MPNLISTLALTLLAGASDTTIYAAVASNFAEVHDRLQDAFHDKTGVIVEASYGSTGKLYAQIVNGGPFHVFLSADTKHVALLIDRKLADADTRCTYAVGRLALYAPTLSHEDLGPDVLRSPSIKHLAIANPKTAPYGSAAESVLRKLSLWDSFSKQRLVIGENIAQTFQFIQSGGAEAGFVAYSQVKTRDRTSYWLVPQEMHAPITQDAVVLAPGKSLAAARDYVAFLQSPEAVAVIESHGYSTVKQ